jgi:rRNA maturation RNase YbeY
MPEGERSPAARGVTRLEVVVADERGRPLSASGLAAWLRGVAPARARGVVVVALVSDARVRTLNRTYRQKDYATDVLSFPAFDRTQNARASARQARSPQSPRLRSSPVHRATAGPSDQPPPKLRRSAEASAKAEAPQARRRAVPGPFLGDIVIARGVARRQAREARHSVLTELKVLALHGLLHLLGYDHRRDEGRMHRIERRLRRKGGLREGLIERAHA